MSNESTQPGAHNASASKRDATSVTSPSAITREEAPAAPRPQRTDAPTTNAPSQKLQETSNVDTAASPNRTVYRTQRPVVRISIPDGWLRGILAGVQAALMGWALCTLIVLAAYLSVVDNPWMNGTSWSDAMSAGATLWAMTLGATVIFPLESESSAQVLRAVPTLLTAVSILSVRAFTYTRRDFPRTSYLFAVPAFVGVSTFLIGANKAWVSWPSTVLGATLVALLGVAWAWRTKRRSVGEANLFARFVPEYAVAATRGLRVGVGVVVALAALSTLGLGLSVLLKWQSVQGIAQILAPVEGFDTAMLVVAQLLYVPSAAAWFAAWGSGAGFSLGDEAFYSIGTTTVAPIPPIPLLGVLPGNAWGYGWIGLIVVLGLLAGALLGVVFEKRALRLPVAEEAVASGVAVAVFALAMAVWMALSRLTLGSGRLALLGPDALLAALVLTGVVALPVCVGLLCSHGAVITSVVTYVRRARGLPDNENVTDRGDTENVTDREGVENATDREKNGEGVASANADGANQDSVNQDGVDQGGANTDSTNQNSLDHGGTNHAGAREDATQASGKQQKQEPGDAASGVTPDETPTEILAMDVLADDKRREESV